MQKFEQGVKTVLDIVSKATREKRPKTEETAFQKKLDLIAGKILEHSIYGFVTTVILAILTFAYRSTPLFTTTIMVGNIVFLLCIALELTVIVSMVPGIRNIRKEPYGNNLKSLAYFSDLHLSYFLQLRQHEKKVLNYVLIHYKNEKQAMELRTNLIAGAIQKIGFVPALAGLVTIYISVHDHHDLQWAVGWFIFVILFFNCLSFASALMQHRMNEIIALLEFAISEDRSPV